MEEIHKLRGQLSRVVQANFRDTDVGFVSNPLPPNELQVASVYPQPECVFTAVMLQLKVIRQLITAGFIDQVAVRKDRVDKASSTGVQSATSKGVLYRALGISEDVFIHPSSVLANRTPPEYIVFNEIVRSSRLWLKGMVSINLLRL